MIYIALGFVTAFSMLLLGVDVDTLPYWIQRVELSHAAFLLVRCERLLGTLLYIRATRHWSPRPLYLPTGNPWASLPPHLGAPEGLSPSATRLYYCTLGQALGYFWVRGIGPAWMVSSSHLSLLQLRKEVALALEGRGWWDRA